MNVQQVSAEKKELEDKIAGLINTFECETELDVEELCISHRESTDVTLPLLSVKAKIVVR